MKVPKASPGEGVVECFDRFSYWSIAGGEKHHAYIAGPAAWVIAHPSDKGTKPCVEWMTQRALPCRFCALQKVPQEIGYLPVYRAVDWRPMVVIVYADERQHVDELDTHTRVLIGRERERGAALWVRRCMDQEPKFSSTLPWRRCAVDIDSSLLTLWKMPELVAWLAHREASDNAVSLPTEPTDKAPAGEADRVVAPEPLPYTPPAGDGAAQAADYNATVNRIKERVGALKPSANGRHDKK